MPSILQFEKGQIPATEPGKSPPQLKASAERGAHMHRRLPGAGHSASIISISFIALALLCPRSAQAEAPPGSGQPNQAQPLKNAQAGGGDPVLAISTCPPRLPAISRIACRLKDHLGSQPNALVISDKVHSDLPIERGDELAARIAKLVAGQLGARAHKGPANLGAAQLIARSEVHFIHLEPRLEKGTLSVTAYLYQPNRGFWAQIREPNPPPLAHGFDAQRIDAEIRSFLPKLPLVAQELIQVAAPESQVLALACGDIDGDSQLELAVVGRTGVHLGRVQERRFKVHAQRPWSELSPVAPAPLREPIASAAILEGNYLEVGSSDRKHGVRLDGELKSLGELSAQIPWPDGESCVNTYQHWLSQEQRPCVRTSNRADSKESPIRFDYRGDALAGAFIVKQNGESQLYRALRASQNETADLRSASGEQGLLRQVGAQMHLADLDQDGTPELIVSSPTLDPKQDEIVIYSWRGKNQFSERKRVRAEGGVSALTSCPSDDRSAPWLVAAVGQQLWLIR